MPALYFPRAPTSRGAPLRNEKGAYITPFKTLDVTPAPSALGATARSGTARPSYRVLAAALLVHACKAPGCQMLRIRGG